ncbi:MAG: hypothetical protein JNL70_17570 [Saprospiraceae bacterium]|nr:hypothetical protein [Saprospiraceae bacterium]
MEHGLVQWVLYLLERYFPRQKTKVEPFSEPIDVAQSISLYNKWLIPTGLLMVVWVVSVTYGVGNVAADVTKYILQWVYSDTIVLNFAMVWYLIVGFIAMIHFPNFFDWFIIKLKDKQTLSLIKYGTQLKTNYDIEAVMPLLKKVVFAFSFIIFLLGGTTHLRVYKDRFVMSTLIQKDEVYSFNQIASITHAEKVHYSNDEDRITPLIEVKMKDGTTWESNDFDIEKNSSVFRLIAQRAGLSIDSVPLIYKPRYH